ncbi:hypothetical protein PPACK8108_LOCUS3351 [Phakopsora pachyrhizi]|uniref:Uncharacterized protein n=1 Tax=Phakopsora pachyrhizi TaxID=170000 RepID=A0AAV0AJV8_PHAPC|nr:hypothetical protein PPACK8108_LOCUS3351 [Phakopsora pachyrhizi]
MSFQTNQIESNRFDGNCSTQLSDLISEVLLNRVDSRAGKSIINNNCQDKKEQGRDLATSSKTKISKSLERRRNELEAQRVVSNSTRQSGLELPEPIRLIELDREIFKCEALPRIRLLHPDLIGNVIFISNSISHEDSNSLNLLMIKVDSGKGINTWDDSDMSGEFEQRGRQPSDQRIGGFDLSCDRFTKGDRDEDLIFKLYLDSDIYHTYIHKKLTLAEVGSSSGRPRPACLPDPTKKRRISQTIDQNSSFPRTRVNATEETTLIPQIKEGQFRTLNLFSIIVFRKEREKDQRINEELEQRNQS